MNLPTSFPSHCWSCGAALMGGATQHKTTCAFYDLTMQALNDNTTPRRKPQKVRQKTREILKGK